MVAAGVDQIVVLVELRARHRDRLHADKAADLAPHRAHERLALPQAVDDLPLGAVFIVIAGVEVREDGARLLASRAGYFDHIFDSLA